MECCKNDTVSYSKNSKINEGIIDPIVNKPEFITLSTADVENIYIISKQSEASIRVTPSKKHFCKLFQQHQLEKNNV